MPPPPEERQLQVRSRKRLMPYLAALASAGLGYRVRGRGDQATIAVAEDDGDAARREIDEYEQANRGWPPPSLYELADDPREGADAPTREDWFPCTLIALALVFFFLFVGPFDPSVSMLESGVADSVRIRAGEWWRIGTALTLHADFRHVMSNAAVCVLFGIPACRAYGHGMTWLLAVGSGLAGNLVTALVVAAPHRSVGASTATFALLGLVVTAQAARQQRRFGPVRTIWHASVIACLGGVGALALLGTSPDSDLRAHLAGFVFGALGGILPARLPQQLESPVLQWMLFAAAVGIVCLCWWPALQYP